MIRSYERILKNVSKAGSAKQKRAEFEEVLACSKDVVADLKAEFDQRLNAAKEKYPSGSYDYTKATHHAHVGMIKNLMMRVELLELFTRTQPAILKARLAEAGVVLPPIKEVDDSAPGGDLAMQSAFDKPLDAGDADRLRAALRKCVNGNA